MAELHTTFTKRLKVTKFTATLPFEKITYAIRGKILMFDNIWGPFVKFLRNPGLTPKSSFRVTYNSEQHQCRWFCVYLFPPFSLTIFFIVFLIDSLCTSKVLTSRSWKPQGLKKKKNTCHSFQN